MTPKITPEMRDAIDALGGKPVLVQDEERDTAYWLVAKADAPELVDRWLQRELQKGFDAADRGDIVDWDPEQIKRDGRSRLAHETRDS